MPEPYSFYVRDPLVLNKPFIEHAKFFVKEAMAYFGHNHKGWADYRRNYEKPWQVMDHLRVARLDTQTITAVVERSSHITLPAFKKEILGFTEDELPRTTQGLALPLLREIMTKDGVHKRIMDIGSCYSKIFCKLAMDFPEFEWDMVDFPANLEEANADIRTPGMHFYSCYPLDFVERTEARYDIANFNRTLALMGVEQIGNYLTALRSKTSYVVFAEPCKILFQPGSLNLDGIPVETPLPKSGGHYFVHNYRKLFERFGYKLIHYDADSSKQINSTPLHFIIRGVAVPGR